MRKLIILSGAVGRVGTGAGVRLMCKCKHCSASPPDEALLDKIQRTRPSPPANALADAIKAARDPETAAARLRAALTVPEVK